MTAVAARLAPRAPAPRTALVFAAHAAAFRALLGDAATPTDDARPGGFRADVSRLALAPMARTFDFEAGAIAVLDQAQFERRPVTVTPHPNGLATLACGDGADDLPAARRPPAR